MLIKNTRCKYFSDYSCFEYKNSEIENKAQNTGCLITTTVLNTKISEVENEIPGNSKYITIQEN